MFQLVLTVFVGQKQKSFSEPLHTTRIYELIKGRILEAVVSIWSEKSCPFLQTTCSELMAEPPIPKVDMEANTRYNHHYGCNL